MGGKRSDQDNVDPAEAGATNPKRRSEARGGDESNQAGSSEGTMTDDEKIDEASQESFPASDPPAQP